MESLLNEIRKCKICEEFLPHSPNPIVSASSNSKILIIGQAPGSKVHESGIPWDDQSGDTLRNWMEVHKSTFYDSQEITLVPMGFCYPGKGKSGDLPPRSECAEAWHDEVLEALKSVELTLLVGQYAQFHYLGERWKGTLTNTVKSFKELLPEIIPLPHPSPRNRIWLKKNPWFSEEVLPSLKESVSTILS